MHRVRLEWAKAVLFLDPCGMQVDWEPVEAMAHTRAIDTWILFPLGVAVNRLLTRDGEMPASWRSRLDRLFGSADWYNAFYKEEVTSDLFGEVRRTRKLGTFKSISEYYNDRLRTVFAKVADNPRRLCNSKENPLFLLCFAAANPKGAEIAIRIAQHILKG